MTKIPLYPLKFKPILKHYLWGGHNLARLFPGKIDSSEPVAESWEIADINGDVSVIENGPLAGMSLRELLETRGEEVLGKEAFEKYGGKFPLLIKLIDAEDQLSLQVHPDDDYAREHEGGKRGKTEMWYILEAQPGAKLTCGFKEGVTQEDFLKAQKEENFEPILQSYETQPGDVYFVPSGTIHSIGKGNILLEVQVSSDITYRIHDWSRVDKKTGQPRETHIEKSKEVLKFDESQAGKLKKNEGPNLLICDLFKVDKLSLSNNKELPLENNIFSIFFMQKGEVELISSNGDSCTFSSGDVYLIPSSIQSLRINKIDPDHNIEMIQISS